MNACKQCGEEIPLNHVQVGGVHLACEHDYFHKKDQKRILIRPLQNKSQWLVECPKSLIETLANADISEEFEIKLQMYSKGELEALPEFTGW